MKKNRGGIAAVAVLTAAFMIMSVFLTGCNNKENEKTGDPVTEDTSVATDTGDAAQPETEEIMPVTGEEIEQEEPAIPVDVPVLETTPPPETQTPPETTAPQPETQVKPDRLTSDFINMLTGLPATKEEYYTRPVAIMINNLRKSTPQWGIGEADVIYECMVEGGITRLMMLATNYDKIGVIGSVRSSREYYVDLAQNHDAIYVHAGGSSEAYNEIQSRKINNLDGVNMSLPNGFYRDEWRRANMGMEHSLMTTGERISSSVSFKKYRSEIKDTFVSPFHFVSYDGPANKLESGGEARHVIITYTNAHFPQYIYVAKTNTYKRYQYNGVEHIDGVTGKQLEFTNVLILNLVHKYTNDAYGHVNVTTTGSGDGYYISGGRYIPIKWSKATKDSPVVLTNTDGTALMMNCGKTFVNIVSAEVWKTIQLNYKRT